MWNKLCLIFVIVGLAWSLSAQSYRSRRRNRNRNTTATTTQEASEQQKSKEQQSKKETSSTKKNTKKTSANQQQKPPYGRKFDPGKPNLTEDAVKKILDEDIRKKVLERKIPEKLKDCKAEEFFSESDCSSMLMKYRILTSNFELVEVTWVKPEWYQRYGMELAKFKPIAFEMYVAMSKRSDTRFAAAVRAFEKQQQACLKFLKEKPPRISKEQYEALVLKNTKIRKQNYLKILQEKRQAEIKRREIQLKQLQQRSQGAQKPAQGAGK